MSLKKKLSIILRVCVSVGLLGGLIWLMRKDAANIGDILAACNMWYLVAAIFVFCCNSLGLAWRLKVIFHGENLYLSFAECLQLTYMGYFFNNFMPTAVGGDVIKAHFSVKSPENRIRSYASVMMDRLIGLYSFLVVAAFAIIVDGGRFQIAIIRPLVFSLLAGGVVIFAALTNRRVAEMMERFFAKIKLGKLGDRLDAVYKIVHDYRNRLDIVGKGLAISIILQSVYFFTIYLFFLALGSSIGLGNLFLVMPVVTFISMIPSIGGLGVREGAMVAFFSPLVGRDTSFAVSLLLLFGLFIISFVGGLTYLYWINFKRKKS